MVLEPLGCPTTSFERPDALLDEARADVNDGGHAKPPKETDR
jgi:hypothetical protein